MDSKYLFVFARFQNIYNESQLKKMLLKFQNDFKSGGGGGTHRNIFFQNVQN